MIRRFGLLALALCTGLGFSTPLFAATDACAVVTVEEVGELLGSAVAAGVPAAAAQSRPAKATGSSTKLTCTFTSANQETLVVELRTLTKPMTKEAFADEVKRLAEVLGERGSVQAVDGVGDLAMVSHLGPREGGADVYRGGITVFQGTRQLSLNASLNGRKIADEPLKALALKALARP